MKLMIQLNVLYWSCSLKNSLNNTAESIVGLYVIIYGAGDVSGTLAQITHEERNNLFYLYFAVPGRHNQVNVTMGDAFK